MNGMVRFLMLAPLVAISPGRAADSLAPQPASPPLLSQANSSGPRIQFATPVYDFGRTPMGEPIRYTYIFTNIGTATLVISNVHPQCGCTAAGEWTKEIEPGQTGSIPIQFNSTGFGGPVAKVITVTCNDRTQPSIGLQLKGTIWKPIDVNPPFAVLTITADSSGASGVVRIQNNMEDPLVLTPPECSSKAFTAVLKTNVPGKDFELIVSAVTPVTPGSVQGQVTMRTSATNTPMINVTVWANVLPVISVAPPQITLPQPPLGKPITNYINIVNNSTNPVSISEPAINAQNVQIQLQEKYPGKYFSAVLVFPEGYQVPQGTAVEFTAKTTNPKFPTVRVPVIQPAPAPVASQQFSPAPLLATPAHPPPQALPRPALPRTATVRTAPSPPNPSVVAPPPVSSAPKPDAH
jgi:hypothetical protein